jgi:Bacterial cellulose synthase subunit
VRAIAVAFVVLCCLAAAPAAAAAADASPPPVGQDVTLAGLGIGAQTVYGAHTAAEIAFPPAVTRLASAGSFVRVFFSHSPDAAAGSSMLIAVNGQPLLTVPLTSGTAGGGVLETRLPASLLEGGTPNRLQVRFTLTGPSTTMYGRVDPLTTLHYELAGSAGGVPGLEQYPYPLLAANAASPALGVVLPVAPSPGDLAAAFRVLADVGRRAPSQRVRPQVVSGDQLAWLGAGGVAAVLVGRLDGLPAAAAVLEAAGWRRGAGGWTAPDGRVLGAGDGLVAGAVSPWDHRTPLLLVTGTTDRAVARAASALVSGTDALNGRYVVVADATTADPTGPPRDLKVRVLSPRDLAAFGSGRYRATVSFTAPAVDPADTAVLELTVPALGAAVPAGSVEADVNGSWVAATALDGTGVRPSRLVASFSGRLLRPGRNALSLEFRIDGRPGQALATDALTAGVDTATAALSLPDPAPTAGDLRLLPFPFLEGGRALQVVLGDAAEGTLGAAAQAMVALGSRSTQPPPALRVAYAGAWDGSGDDHLLVVGRPPAGSAVEAIGAHLPVVFDRGGGVTVGGPGSSGRVRMDSSVGAVEELRTADASGRQVLWLAGTGPDVLAGAARALYDPRLGGSAATVDVSGRLSILGAAAAAAGLGPSTAQVGGAIAAVLIAVVVGLQLLRPRRTGVR